MSFVLINKLFEQKSIQFQEWLSAHFPKQMAERWGGQLTGTAYILFEIIVL